MARRQKTRRDETLFTDTPPSYLEPVPGTPHRPSPSSRFPAGLENQEMAPPRAPELAKGKAPEAPSQATPKRAARPTETAPAGETDWEPNPRLGNQGKRLHREIGNLYAQVQIEVGSNRQLTEECLEHLSRARELLSQGKPEVLPQAELSVEKVRARLQRARESDAVAHRLAGRILAWEALWLAVFILALLNAGRLVERSHLADEAASAEAAVLVAALAWGGIGGTLAGFYSLPWRIARREYDGQFNFLYYVQPAMGLALGGMAFLAVNIALTTLLGQAPSFGPPLTGTARPSLVPHFIYLLSALAGFKQEFVYQFLDRVLSAFLPKPPRARK